MNDKVLRLYHRLPGSLRSLVATGRGLQLRSWRYGPETEGLIAEALDREQWSAAQWQDWRRQQLSFVLHRAVKQVPYYRDQWAARRRKGDRASWEYLENWPILTKEALRENPQRFVADDCDIRRMFTLQTSGTTGKSLSLWWTRETVRRWYALFEARWRRWNGVSRHDRWAALGGQLITPVSLRRPPFWVWNTALNQLYMSSYHLTPELIPYYLDALVRYRIKYLWGYSSALYTLAQEALRLGLNDLKLTVAITNAEPLYSYQRKTIAEAFACPVRETYGMSEIVVAASECEANHLHLWPEAGCLELTQDDQAVPRGEAGELICTGLVNTDMPLIRYRVGDRARLPEIDETCRCGRSLPMIAAIEGRADDVLYTSDGGRVGRLDPVFKEQLPVKEVQLIQEAIDRIRVLYVPAADFTDDATRSISKRLKDRMGNINVVFQEVDEVPRGANGKFRSVICQLSQAERLFEDRVTK